jgi:hypothetical protein
MGDSPWRQARELGVRSAQLRQDAAALLRRAEDAIVAARLTVVVSRADAEVRRVGEQPPEHWATLVEEAAQQLIVTEMQALLGEGVVPRADEDA